MNALTKQLTLLSAIALLLLTSGCFDTKEEYTINPDGSGKVVHECTFQQINFNNSEPDEAMRAAVKEVVRKSQGIDVWRDVSFKLLNDGRIYFRGTAYFPHLAKLNIANQTLLEFGWIGLSDGTGTLVLRTNKNPQSDSISVTKEPQTASTNKLSPEELTAKMREQRAKYQQAKPMLSAFLGNLKQEAVFHLPGKVANSTNFKKTPAGDLTISFDGSKVVELLDKLANDDDWFRRHNGEGFGNMQDKPNLDDEMAALLFGSKAPVKADVTGAKTPLFNYEAEVAAARKQSAALEKQLGVPSGAMAPPAKGQPIKHAEIVGVRLINWTDDKQDLRPFSWSKGYEVSVLVELPGSVLSVTDKSAVETATADDGSDLLMQSESDRHVSFPHLSKDKTKALLEFKLQNPGPSVRGLKELSGTVQYKVSTGTREEDLGITELRTGAKGTNLNASIRSIGEGWRKDGSQELLLKLRLTPDELKTIYLVVDGKKTAVERRGWSGFGDNYEFTLASNDPFPPAAHLVVEVFDKAQTFSTPFKIENVSLLGSAMK